MSLSESPQGYSEARTSAAWFEPEAGWFFLRGPESQDFLHRMVTNDVKSLAPGEGVYALMLDINGRMTADLHALILDPERILIEAHASTTDTLIQTLDRYIIMEQVELEDARHTLSMLSLQGPEAHRILSNALDLANLPSGPDRILLSKHDWIIAARDRSGQGGFDIYCAPEQRDACAASLESSGASHGSAEALDVLRLEAGIPMWGAELTEAVIPLEANLEGIALSFTKGCYPGQEIIARIHSRGRPAKHLAGIRFEGPPPIPGSPVEDEGETIGSITSAVHSPTLGGIALAYLRKESGVPGTRVVSGGVPGMTSDLPFSE